jgi:uncharacterized protein (DUF486 family)
MGWHRTSSRPQGCSQAKACATISPNPTARNEETPDSVKAAQGRCDHGRMLTVVLLLISNTFMTFAWYGHLRHRSAPLIEAIVVSWLIAFGEYCFQVPANRIGYDRFTGYQLKIIQECVTVVVFVAFAYFYLGEPLRLRYAGSLVCIVGAVLFAFWGR